jgi:hypothetical protein
MFLFNIPYVIFRVRAILVEDASVVSTASSATRDAITAIDYAPNLNII